MDNTFVVLEQPNWWLLIAALLALAFAATGYFKVNYPWSRGLTWTLATLRFVGTFLLLLLLLDPLLRQVINRIETPHVAIVYDNSESVGMMTDSVRLTQFNDELKKIISELESDGISTDFITLNDASAIESLAFDAKITDLSRVLRATSDKYEGQNLVAIVLVSDGIYNRGVAPSYLRFPHPVITLGLGDTIPPKDLFIREVKTNSIAYQGNKFPMEVLVGSEGYDDIPKVVSLLHNGRTIEEKEITNERRVTFEVIGENAGLNRYTVRLSDLEGETSWQNNKSSVFVDVVDGKERILIVGPAPHPDIAAIRRALRKSDNYETQTYIPGISKEMPVGEYDVVIEHQAFTRNSPKLQLEGNPARWYILSSRSQIDGLATTTGVSVTRKGNQRDNVVASFNPTFSAFGLDPAKTEVFSGFTPISVPFGEYAQTGPVQPLIYQQVGSVVTSRPLLSVFDDGSTKSALLMGEGIWKWRLLEGIEYAKVEGFDDLITKLIQYLSVKADKRKFRFKPAKSSFAENESIVFHSELYNDIYEEVFDYEVNLRITGEAGQVQSFEYFPAAGGRGLDIGALSEGVYKFSATTTLGNESFNLEGDFQVENLNFESLLLTADHRLLREIASSNQGTFLKQQQVDRLSTVIDQLEPRGIVRSNETFSPFIKNWKILLIVVAIFSVEWFCRKYFGAY